MKTPSLRLVFKTGLILCALLILSCEESKKEEAVVAEEEVVVPMIELASDEYSDIVQKQLDLLGAFDFDGFGLAMADDVEWLWPDGSSATRSSITGKADLINWWKNWKTDVGAEKMTFANNTFLPLKVNEPTNHYKVTGTGVLSYTDMTLVVKGKTTEVRMHAVFMFNDDKKISHAFFYYDRTGILEISSVSLKPAK